MPAPNMTMVPDVASNTSSFGTAALSWHAKYSGGLAEKVPWVPLTGSLAISMYSGILSRQFCAGFSGLCFEQWSSTTPNETSLQKV